LFNVLASGKVRIDINQRFARSRTPLTPIRPWKRIATSGFTILTI
jgi:hypothetical protein